MEEQDMGERAQSFCALSEPATCPASPHAHQPQALGSCPLAILWRLHNIGLIDEIIGHW